MSALEKKAAIRGGYHQGELNGRYPPYLSVTGAPFHCRISLNSKFLGEIRYNRLETKEISGGFGPEVGWQVSDFFTHANLAGAYVIEISLV